ncbi:MAG: hypothetical protein ACK56F_12440, partial [bacterium]
MPSPTARPPGREVASEPNRTPRILCAGHHRGARRPRFRAAADRVEGGHPVRPLLRRRPGRCASLPPGRGVPRA